MDSSAILAALDRLARTTNRAAKLADLTSLLDDPLFALVTRLTYDPFITFGVKAPQATSRGYREISAPTDTIFDLLSALQHRRLTGAVARSSLNFACAELTLASGELVRRILSRNLNCGVSLGTLNSVRPGHVPTFDVMLAGKFDDKLLLPTRRYVAEPKKDGMRAICLVRPDSAQFITRNGRPLPALGELAQTVAAFVRVAYRNSALPTLYGDGFHPMLVLDGEIISGDLCQTISDVRQTHRQSPGAKFEIFDVLPLTAFMSEECIQIPFFERRHTLERLFIFAPSYERLSLIEQRPVENASDCHRLRDAWVQQGFEGAMIKDLHGLYQKGRSHAWLKLKKHDTEDIPITGIFEGTGRHADTLGGVVCDFNGRSVRISSGFSVRQRQQLWPSRDQLAGRLIEVAFQELTPNGSLRHPRFIRFRADKDNASVSS